MKNFINILLICVLAGVMTSSCGNDEEFVINCEIKGIGERGVEMIYFNRGLRKAAFHPVDDKVSLRGSSPDMTVVEVFTLDNQLLFTCVAQNGDELEVKMELDNPASIKVKGNEASEQYNKFVSENAELLGSRDEAGINALISKEISARPDKISSTLILTRLLRARGNELLADSLINRLAPEARPSSLIKGFAAMVGEQVSTNARGDVRPITLRQGRDTVSGRDTTVRFVPSFHSYSLLAFTYERKSDTITNRLRELKKDFPKSKRFEGLEISLQNDSSSWRLAIKGDSAEWLQAWDPGGSASPQIRSLAVPSTPFFIETDSTGKQLYRGSAVKAATDTLRNRLGKADISQPDTDADTDTKEANAKKANAGETADSRSAAAPEHKPAPKGVTPAPKGTLQRAPDDRAKRQTVPLKRKDNGNATDKFEKPERIDVR